MNESGENTVWAGQYLRMADVPSALMATFDAIERENVKKLVQALKELDDCFIEAARDTVLSSRTPKTDLLSWKVRLGEM